MLRLIVCQNQARNISWRAIAALIKVLAMVQLSNIPER
ncbi:hypothetical membrane protein [Pseudomonas veronii 1YdBTEX2]|uniref:Hypothetical membrane protein n=1 Tax=Pseudomonas veronii 1YdBTEX2 TaxID=1295141 RepID=A0A1D3K7X4_PSEVE|nr:hypothetical membrane protein [Pseudomonas veronii 1YdBTEX2]